MKIELLEMSGLIPALQAMRLPYSGNPLSFVADKKTRVYNGIHGDGITEQRTLSVSHNDLELASKLINGGDEHAKCLRGIMAYIKVEAPRYFWQEFATYSVGCVCLSSTSTMHTISKGVTSEMFEADNEREAEAMANFLQPFIDHYNNEAETKEEKDAAFLDIKRNIPESFLQTRIFAISYQTLRRIYFQRRNHRLPHWREFCEFVKQLPYAKELILPTKSQ